MKDLIIIDNIFDDPDSILNYALNEKYYDSENHPHSKNSILHWKGMRTSLINESNPSFFNKNISAIINKFINVKTSCEIHLEAEMYFHYMNKSFSYNESWLHKDSKCYIAGVVYLNKTPSENSGTIIIKQDEKVIVENVFNRLVLYNSQFLHSPLNGFGDILENSRLTMTLFFNQLNIKEV